MALYRNYRRKTGIQKGKSTYTRYNKISYKKGIKQPQNQMGRWGRPPTMSKVISMINTKLANAIENKLSDNHENSQSVALWSPTATTPNWYHYPYTNFFDVNPGAGEFQRIGNRFKLKKWIIKGLIYPDAMMENDITSLGQTVFSNTFIANSYAGKVTVFLGKVVDGTQSLQTLPNLWQNGPTSITPVGGIYEQLYTVNKDVYKIYWKQSFNMGMSNVPINQYGVSSGANATNGYLSVNTLPNNDLKIQRQFYIDVTKYIGKNATIKFNDNSAQAYIPSSLEGLALFAVFSPFNGSLIKPTAEAANNSFFKIHTTSFYEYEDA